MEIFFKQNDIAFLKRLDSYLWIATLCGVTPFFSLFLTDRGKITFEELRSINTKITAILDNQAEYLTIEENLTTGSEKDFLGLKQGMALTESDITHLTSLQTRLAIFLVKISE